MSEIQLSAVGQVGGNVQFRTDACGVDVASFRVVCSRRRYDLETGRWADGPPTWLTVVCYRALARHVAASLREGDPVVAVGRLRSHRWAGGDGSMSSGEVLEAVAVGHDLGGGTSTFRMALRLPEAVDEPVRS